MLLIKTLLDVCLSFSILRSAIISLCTAVSERCCHPVAIEIRRPTRQPNEGLRTTLLATVELTLRSSQANWTAYFHQIVHFKKWFNITLYEISIYVYVYHNNTQCRFLCPDHGTGQSSIRPHQFDDQFLTKMPFAQKQSKILKIISKHEPKTPKSIIIESLVAFSMFWGRREAEFECAIVFQRKNTSWRKYLAL